MTTGYNAANLEFRRLSLLTMLFIEPSEEEIASVCKLKESLLLETTSPHARDVSDVKVLRFLRGRNHIHDKTLHGLVKHCEWREQYKVDEILHSTDSFLTELNTRKIANVGLDLKSRPIICLFARRHNKDMRDINEIQSCIIHCLETAMTRVNAKDEKILIVFDLSQFALSCMDYEVVKMLVNILQFNYPEILSAALIVNSPLIFSACWQIIRLMLDPVTAAKCVFIKPSQLCEYIHPDDIPEDIQGVIRTEGNRPENESKIEIDPEIVSERLATHEEKEEKGADLDCNGESSASNIKTA